MKIFITGGTGFIGPYVAKKLIKNGHDLLLLSYEEEEINQEFLEKFNAAEFVSGSLSKISKWKKTLKTFNPDLSIHMAWEGIPDYTAKMSVKNLNNSLNLFLTLAEIGCGRILTAGSCWEYGRTQGQLTEEMNPRPNNPFTSAKNAIRMMGGEIAKENGMQFIWTRFFYVYGPGQKPSSLLPYIINSVLKKKIPQIKTPSSKNDFIYVEDIASAVSSIINKCKDEQAVYNIGSGYSTSVQKITEIVYEKTNTPLPDNIIQQRTQSGSIVDFWADITKIQTEIGWKPRVSITDGIEKTVNFYNMKLKR